MPALPSTGWTLIFAVAGVAIVLSGTYRFLEKLLTVMVVTFTLITLSCAVLLQFTEYALTWNDVRAGLNFEFPALALAAALAAFGATGVTANENIAYTYWCTEKGYARFAGPDDGSAAWVARAKGWIRVLQTDVWLTLGVLTLATVPFYMLGEWAFWLFMAGAFFVLFSTLVSGLGGSARMFADAMVVLDVISGDDYRARLRVMRIFAVISPSFMTLCYYTVPNPVWLLTIGGIFFASLAPVVAIGIVYLRYHHTAPRLEPRGATDALMWICVLAMLGLGGYVVYLKFA